MASEDEYTILLLGETREETPTKKECVLKSIYLTLLLGCFVIFIYMFVRFSMSWS
jgi:hypothetical protein